MIAHGLEIHGGETAIALYDAAVNNDVFYVAADCTFGERNQRVDDGELIGIVHAHQHDVGELAYLK